MKSCRALYDPGLELGWMRGAGWLADQPGRDLSGQDSHAGTQNHLASSHSLTLPDKFYKGRTLFLLLILTINKLLLK